MAWKRIARRHLQPGQQYRPYYSHGIKPAPHRQRFEFIGLGRSTVNGAVSWRYKDLHGRPTSYDVPDYQMNQFIWMWTPEEED